MKRPVRNRLHPYAEDPDLGAEDLALLRLGACAMIDMHYWGGVVETPIDAYVGTTEAAVRAGQVLILTGPDGLPVAYAVWEVRDGQIVLIRQSAPFGDFAALHHALRAALPSGQPVLSRHPGAPVEEQRLW